LDEFFPKTENLIEEGEKTGILPYNFTFGGGSVLICLHVHVLLSNAAQSTCFSHSKEIYKKNARGAVDDNAIHEVCTFLP
jgi:hypothetical protein